MNRRELLGVLGTLGVGAVAGADHGKEAKAASPLTGPHAHFCGIHVAKANPKFQLVAQHFCTAHPGDGHGDGLFQCLLFDSMEKNAKLLGVEYIISDKQFRDLPEAEKKYWHPHTYEVLAGGLIAPGMSADDEQKFMKTILTTWGKTWHTWPDPTTAIPIGEPLLMWAVTGDGQIDEKVVAERDRQFKIETEKVRERRIREIGYEVPQVPPPKSIETVGRQWTSKGDDKPTPKK